MRFIDCICTPVGVYPLPCICVCERGSDWLHVLFCLSLFNPGCVHQVWRGHGQQSPAAALALQDLQRKQRGQSVYTRPIHIYMYHILYNVYYV